VNRHIVCADRVQLNTFYAYSYEGVWRSTDGGKRWSKVHPGFGGTGANGTGAKLFSVPNFAGHLFFAKGTTGTWDVHPYKDTLRRSTDGGATWTKVPGFLENWSVTAGKAAPGQAYPAIYVAGVRGDGTGGIYRSDDNCATWVLLTHNDASLDAVRDIAADMGSYGTIYVGLGGSGVIYGKLA